MKKLYLPYFSLLLFSVTLTAASAVPALNNSKHNTQTQYPRAVIMHFDPATKAAMEAHFAAAEAENAKGDMEMDAEAYKEASIYYKRAIAIEPIFDSYTVNLASAMIGLGERRQALNLLHNLYYKNGRNLYTSSHNLKGYMIYALLEDEAGKRLLQHIH